MVKRIGLSGTERDSILKIMVECADSNKDVNGLSWAQKVKAANVVTSYVTVDDKTLATKLSALKTGRIKKLTEFLEAANSADKPDPKVVGVLTAKIAKLESYNVHVGDGSGKGRKAETLADVLASVASIG